jgi:Tol biopolymer transport system component
MNADGTAARRLTRARSADDRDPDWSPDGRRIAFWREARVGTQPAPGSRPAIWVINADGSGARLLTRGRWPAWSPDGKTIAYQRDGIFLIAANGTRLRRLTSRGGEPSWSPDGARIAYTNFNGRHTEIRVMDADGTNLRVLTPRGMSASGAVWAPDGQMIVFQTYAGQFVVPAEGGRARRFMPVVTLELYALDDLTWSPDARTIAFIDWTGEAHEIYRINTDGAGLRRLTRTRVAEYGVDWSPAS